ncbi:PrsW family glutamic-type intramembrane protease [Tenacibaculum maritimum]|nr:PrsW family glutamic-type intramembrane protease [Tenacibaculum maritimum]MDB0612759.1 PrsW family glutamic-type intramembrane protease [Tenacibaculum maritimum]
MGLLLLGVAPAMIIMSYIYFKDKFEKEPVAFLAKNFILGVTFSILLTAVLGGVFHRIFPITDSKSIFQLFIKAFITVGFVEEFSKYLVVRFYAQPNKEFNEPFDGIVYAVMVSMGFATLENILYVYQYGAETGITRAFTAVPAHATFAILMGYFMGKAKFSKYKVQLNLTGLILATFFHGAYDFFLFIHFIPGISAGAFISLAVGIILSNRAIKLHAENSKFKN